MQCGDKAAVDWLVGCGCLTATCDSKARLELMPLSIYAEARVRHATPEEIFYPAEAKTDAEAGSAPFIRVLSSPARSSMKASASASFWKRMPQLHSAPTDLRDLGGSTCLSSVPCA